MPLTFQSGQNISEGVYTPVGAPAPAPSPFDGFGSPQERAMAANLVQQAQQQAQQQADYDAINQMQGVGIAPSFLTAPMPQPSAELAQSYYVPQARGPASFDGYGSPAERSAQTQLADALVQIRQQQITPPIDYSIDVPLLGKITPPLMALFSGLDQLQYRQVEKGLLGGEGEPIFDQSGRIAGVVTPGFLPGFKHYIGRKLKDYTGKYEELVRDKETNGDDDEQPTRPQCPPGFVYDENIQACVPMQSAATQQFDVNAPLANVPTYQAGSLLGTTPMGVL
jgi:hypothetical protein